MMQPIDIETIRSLEDLRQFVRHTLCQHEGLLEDQFPLSVTGLRRAGRDCGLQFMLFGPRSVRLGAVWDADRNSVYFYDARGERFRRANLVHRLETGSAAAPTGA